MIPSILSRQIRQGLIDFLNTTFPITTPLFHGILQDLLETEGEVFKGPYLRLGLPFEKARGEKDFFPEIPLPFSPYGHQERAFERLGADAPKSTIVATGTGSGKTESFLLPILRYCYQHRGEPGIKAILIYPMNALATDQAARIARTIRGNEKLRGNVTAGIYIGQAEKNPSRVMGPGAVIADKETMRLRPPDILLTNYKMLDYLLIRPGDLALWQQNRPQTLKFLVVDDLHTFDGAQGTDLACLIRRLKARVKSPEGHLCCIGTSATLGTEKERRDIIAYASNLFAEPFGEDAIIEEERVSVQKFLTGAAGPSDRVPRLKEIELLDPENFDEPQMYILKQIELWFERQDADRILTAGRWPLALGEGLKGHFMFQALLRRTEGRVVDFSTLFKELQGAVPEIKEQPAFGEALLASLLSFTARRQRNCGSRP